MHDYLSKAKSSNFHYFVLSRGTVRGAPWPIHIAGEKSRLLHSLIYYTLRHHTILKYPHTNTKQVFHGGPPKWAVSNGSCTSSQFCYVKIFSTNHNRNLLLLDDPGRVRSQITSVVCQIQRFDFDCNLVVTRKVIIIRIPPGLGLNPVYYLGIRCFHFHVKKRGA